MVTFPSNLMSAAIVFGATEAAESSTKQIGSNWTERSDKDVETKIKFLAAYQKWRFDVFGNDVRFTRRRLLWTAHWSWLNSVPAVRRRWIAFIRPFFNPRKLDGKERLHNCNSLRKGIAHYYLGDEKDTRSLRTPTRFHDPSTSGTPTILFSEKVVIGRQNKCDGYKLEVELRPLSGFSLFVLFSFIALDILNHKIFPGKFVVIGEMIDHSGMRSNNSDEIHF